MAQDETSVILLVVVAIVAVAGLGIALASFVTNESVGGMMNGGPMMNRTTSSTTSPGGLEWGVLVVSAVFLALAVVLLWRARGARAQVAPAVPTTAPAAPVVETPVPTLPPATQVPAPVEAGAAAPVPEPTLVKLLNEDERRMYLELRDHGGEMYQRDLVALGIFSKAKVTRVLDKLEAKGLIVREAHGMTNRVRLVHPPAR